MTNWEAPYSLPEAEGVVRTLLSPTIAGFLKIRENGKIVEPTSAGSGVFVRWPGNIYGILTAAHVLERLPEETDIGLLVFTRKDSKWQFKFKIGKDQKTYPEAWRGEGLPDVGFCRLYEPEIGTLKSKGCVFYDLERARQIMIDRSSYDLGLQPYVCGVLEVSRRPIEDTTAFQAIIGMCALQSTKEVEGYPITIAAPEFDLGYAQPASYGGVSGGGLWLLSASAEDTTSNRVLVGIAFYEVRNANNQLVICCHELESILKLLKPGDH